MLCAFMSLANTVEKQNKTFKVFMHRLPSFVFHQYTVFFAKAQ